jgi:hypothetical protein
MPFFLGEKKEYLGPLAIRLVGQAGLTAHFDWRARHYIQTWSSMALKSFRVDPTDKSSEP